MLFLYRIFFRPSHSLLRLLSEVFDSVFLVGCRCGWRGPSEFLRGTRPLKANAPSRRRRGSLNSVRRRAAQGRTCGASDRGALKVRESWPRRGAVGNSAVPSSALSLGPPMPAPQRREKLHGQESSAPPLTRSLPAAPALGTRGPRARRGGPTTTDSRPTKTARRSGARPGCSGDGRSYGRTGCFRSRSSSGFCCCRSGAS